MAVVRAARGPGQRGGRKPIAEEYAPQIARTLRVFGKNMPALASAYVAETESRDPERCPDHDAVLNCPECGKPSQRKFFDHRAAQYVFDRIMGKPTSRSENSLTVTVVEQLIIGFIDAFEDINGIPDPDTRRVAFARRCGELGSVWGSPAA